MYFSERNRKMLFPDYHSIAERRLVNHIIEEKRVKNLDDCELMCYLNDNCVSSNFKKHPENNEPVHICELNNATHPRYDNDLTTDADFILQIGFSKSSPLNNMEIIMNVYANYRAFDHTVFSFFFHSNPRPFSVIILVFFSPSECLW